MNRVLARSALIKSFCGGSSGGVGDPAYKVFPKSLFMSGGAAQFFIVKKLSSRIRYNVVFLRSAPLANGLTGRAVLEASINE